MKHVPIKAPIHAQNCACPRCRHIRGDAARADAAQALVTAIRIRASAIALLLVPGRWLASAAWTAATSLAR